MARSEMHPADASRRDFLRSMAAAGTAAMMAGEPRTLRAAPAGREVEATRATADTCIILWMAGGMAAPEALDPKRYQPFEVGLPVDRVMSTFPSIDTAIDNIKISQGLEHVAGVMDRATLVRSHVQADLGNILHSRHQYHWHTGYVPPQTVAAPHIGAWMARILGPINPVIPAFINIGQRLEGHGESEELKAFTTGGFLGAEYGPFNLPVPDDAAAAVRPPKGMDRDRFRGRRKLYEELLRLGPGADSASDYHRESIVRSLDSAHRLLDSDDRAAFDLGLEPKEVADAYGPSAFGRGCLLARRLVEAGARFLEVTTEYIPFYHWDTHENGHTTAERMKGEIDRPIARLILDLEERGLLDRTLVVLASEFSRDMMIEGVPGSTAKDQSRAKADVLGELKHYGLHRHFTGGSSVLLFGGGMKRGHLHGETAPERPCVATKDPVTITDLHATILTAMGISPKAGFDVERRPFYVTDNGQGRPVMDLFA